jgi:hypothetical protein
MSMAEGATRLDAGDEQERLADLFAGYFLMPPWAVREAFYSRGQEPETATPRAIYAIANQLGVGYGTLLWQMHSSLGMLQHSRYVELSKASPKQMRQEFLGEAYPNHLVVVDTCWAHVAIDVLVDDLVIVPRGARVEGPSGVVVGERAGGVLIRAVRPGLARVELSNGSWASYLRVARRQYVGLACFRHLEDPDLEPAC